MYSAWAGVGDWLGGKLVARFGSASRMRKSFQDWVVQLTSSKARDLAENEQ